MLKRPIYCTHTLFLGSSLARLSVKVSLIGDCTVNHKYSMCLCSGWLVLAKWHSAFRNPDSFHSTVASVHAPWWSLKCSLQWSREFSNTTWWVCVLRPVYSRVHRDHCCLINKCFCLSRILGSVPDCVSLLRSIYWLWMNLTQAWRWSKSSSTGQYCYLWTKKINSTWQINSKMYWHRSKEWLY